MENNNVADKLYNILGTKFNNTDIKTLDSTGKETTDMEEIEMFSFDFLVESRNYGPVVILLSANSNLEVYYGDNTSKSLDRIAKRKWENLIEHLSTFARSNRLGFSLKHTTDLKYDLSNITDITESYKNIFEGYYGTRKTSYSPQGKAKIIIKHTKAIGEDDKRFRNISQIFIENADGERFKLPFKKLTGARAMARHVTEGGNPYDLFGLHICEMVNDINTLGGFVRRSKMYEGNDDAMAMVETGRTHYTSLRKGLKTISGKRGYHTYKESWEPSAITETDTDTNTIRKLFTEKTVNQRTEDALPLLAKLQQMAEAQELAEKAPPGMEDWIKSNKAEFIDQYGEDKGLEVLYATAWKRHNANESIDWPEEERAGLSMSEDWESEWDATVPDSDSDDRHHGFDDASEGLPAEENGSGAYNDVDEDFSPELREGDLGYDEEERAGLSMPGQKHTKFDIVQPPKEEVTYRKIKDWSTTALKGYARRIGMTPDMIDSRADSDMMIAEIMGYLYDDNWERTVMATGAFDESAMTESSNSFSIDSWSGSDSSKIIDYLQKNNINYSNERAGIITIQLDRDSLEASTVVAQLRQNAKFDEVDETTGNQMEEINEFEQWANNIVEGTWAVPETPDQLKALSAFLAEPQPMGIDALNVTDTLSDIIGDDDLFDQIDEIAADDPDADARPVVIDWIRRAIKNKLEFTNPAVMKNLQMAIKGVREGLDHELDADSETQLSASINNDVDTYLKTESENEDNDMKPYSEYVAEIEEPEPELAEAEDEKKEWKKPWEKDDKKDEEDEDKEEIVTESAELGLNELMERTNFLLKK